MAFGQWYCFGSLSSACGALKLTDRQKGWPGLEARRKPMASSPVMSVRWRVEPSGIFLW